MDQEIGDWRLEIGISNLQSPIVAAQELFRQGNIVAVKGLGGFHLACDATNEEAVAELRKRKGRIDKPFALMMPDVETVEHYCHVSSEERALLESRQRPIVLLQKRDAASPAIADSVAPRQHTLGVMLPYTPLHHLLMADGYLLSAIRYPPSAIRHRLSALVMTSGNFSEEPIATRNDDALTRLAPLADAFLLHDRDIHTRVDDSIVRVITTDSISNPTPLRYGGKRPQSLITNYQLLPLRRSRGYAPYPVKLPFNVPPLLAVGGELKNTFCVARYHYAFLSHHIGDMENLETLKSFEDGVTHFQNLFRIHPEIIAHDLHPDYLSTRYATRITRHASRIPVQHHHAHIASCLAENNHTGDRSVIGVALDGTGFGSDGNIWGGEFLIANYKSFDRVAHLAYIPLPGGDAATRKPARVAFSHLLAANIALDLDLPSVAALSPTEQNIIAKQIANKINSPLTSSMGRLFDAVASIIGVRQDVNYEGQAAIELEAMTDPDETGVYSFEVEQDGILLNAVIQSVVNDFRARLPTPIIAARFHNGVAAMIRDVCLRLREQQAINQVALSGGVFQNITLLKKTLKLLHNANFEVLTHHLVPPNDGGIALGQAVIASYQ
ncbi:MAG: carbamoyltransferase HypF [Chloroflexi bacterium]|nr:carbamoyltransferase HypF [Chloroflexota bacterium]